ncbi:MAG: C39 family peptidase [Clostridia bacterium]|nr:C39 family peptidase [Clostridia bacterium]
MKTNISKKFERITAIFLAVIMLLGVVGLSNQNLIYAFSDENVYTYDEINSILSGSYDVSELTANGEVKFNSANFRVNSRYALGVGNYYICSRLDANMITHTNNALGRGAYDSTLRGSSNNTQLWYFESISDGVNCIRLYGNTSKCLKVNPSTSAVYIGDYVSGDANQNWSISITTNGNKLVSESTGKALYCDDGTFTVSSTSASYFGFFDYSWWIPCTSITMNDVTLYSGQNYFIEPTFKGENGVASNLEEDSPWVTYTVANYSHTPITLNGETASSTGFGINYIRITHRITGVTDTFYIRVNPRQSRIAVTPIQQQNTKWCWAACAEMVGRYFYPSTDRTQKDVSDEIKGKILGLFSKNEMGDVGDIANGIEYVTYNNYTAEPFDGIFSEVQICNLLQSGIPVVAALGNLNSGHAIVIVDCNLSGTTGNVIYTLKYIDPYDASIKTCTYDELVYTGINGITYQDSVLVYGW